VIDISVLTLVTIGSWSVYSDHTPDSLQYNLYLNNRWLSLASSTSESLLMVYGFELKRGIRKLESKKQPKKYSLPEYYLALVKWSRSVKWLMKNRKQSILSSDFVERLMLAVTEVNGCAVCAYGHTQMALTQGFSQEEITAFLSGSTAYVKPEEMKAILFAQHYADTKGIVDQKAYQEILAAYGEPVSAVILAAIQMMMIGNIVGLPISAFQRRLQGKSDSNSSLSHEIGLPLSTLIVIIPALIHGLIETRLHKPSLRFAS